MEKILGLDFGASTTDVVLMHGKILKNSFSFERNQFSEKNFFKLLDFLWKKFSFEGISKIAVTGGKSKHFNGKKFLKIPVVHVDEISAIGFGGKFVSGEKNCLVVSCGTGTCIVQVKGNSARHFGGTGVGGGTILGLSKLLLKTQSLNEIEKLSCNGKLSNVDLSVGSLIGKGIGIVPANATASNFANLKNPSLGDLAFAIQNMAGESIAMLSIFAAKNFGFKKIVFVGKTVSLKKTRFAIERACKMYGIRAIFPERGGIATAIGAAIVR